MTWSVILKNVYEKKMETINADFYQAMRRYESICFSANSFHFSLGEWFNYIQNQIFFNIDFFFHVLLIEAYCIRVIFEKYSYLIVVEINLEVFFAFLILYAHNLCLYSSAQM